MSEFNQKRETVSKYSPRDSIFINHFKEELGKIDSDTAFDNEFQQFKLIMKCMYEMNQAIKKKLVDISDKLELMPDENNMKELHMIWHGGCRLGVARTDRGSKVLQRKIYFGTPPEKEFVQTGIIKTLSGCKCDVCNESIPFSGNMELAKVVHANSHLIELVQIGKKPADVTFTEYYTDRPKFIECPVEDFELPALKNLIPVNQIKDDTWGIQERQTLPLYIAWEGAELSAILNDGKFVNNFSEGIVPKVTADDLKSRTKRTNIFHRPVHFQLSQDLTYHFQIRYQVLNIEWQYIIMYVESGKAYDETENKNKKEILDRDVVD